MKNSKKVVMYVCYFPTAVTEAFIHKCRERASETGILLVYEQFRKTESLNQIFDMVIYKDDVAHLHFADNEEIIEKGIIEYYDNVLNENGLCLEEIDEIYVACDMLNDFAIYLSHYNKGYYYFEYPNNQLTDDRANLYTFHIEHENAHGSAAYFRVAEKHCSICGASPLVRKKIIHAMSDTKRNAYSNYKKYDFPKEILKLSSKEKEILIESFWGNESNIKELCSNAQDSVMILTQRQWKYPVSIQETGILYQYFVDYFFDGEEKVSIKPHPSDVWKHDEFFENVVVFPVAFPADLFPIVDGFNIQCAATVSSTSIEKFVYWCKNRIYVGDLYFRIWRYLNKFWCTYAVIDNLGLWDRHIFRNNIPDGNEGLSLFVRNCLKREFKETQWTSLGNNFDGIALVGSVVFDNYLNRDSFFRTLENLPDASISIFLDLYDNKNFLDYEHIELIENIIPLEIKKVPIKEKVQVNCKNEYIYVYTRSKKYKEALKEVRLSLVLNHVGVILNVSAVESDLLEKIIMHREIIGLQNTVKEQGQIMANIQAEMKIIKDSLN